jgi:translation initiation factor 2D
MSFSVFMHIPKLINEVWRSRKGDLKPISVVVKIRNGRKACTLITNFEPYQLTSEFLADELRKLCASSTAGS